jgi:hypothetical protein
MRTVRTTLMSFAVMSGVLLSSGAAFAQNNNQTVQGLDSRFAELCDTDKDGMVSKKEMMARVEMAWKKADPQGKGMLDRAAVERFNREFYGPN